MDHSSVAAWLRRRAAADAAVNFLSGTMILAGGLLVVTLSFGVAWVVVWLVSRLGLSSIGAVLLDRPIAFPTEAVWIGAAVLVGVLFLANQRLSREYSRSRRPRRRLTHEEIETHSPEELVHLLAYPGASSHPLSDILLTGPRLTGIGLDHLRKAVRLWRLDLEPCAMLLSLLAARPAKVSLLELSGICGVPELERLLPQLTDIPGVLMLHNEPPGLSLTSDLRRELKELTWPPERSDLDDEPDTSLHPASADPEGFAGLGRSTSLEEFEQAYRRRLRDQARKGSAGRAAMDPNAAAIKAAYQTFLEQQVKQPSGPRAENVERLWARYKQTGT